MSTSGLFLFSNRNESKYNCILGCWLFDYTQGCQPVDYFYFDRIESKYACILGGWLFDYTLGHQPVDYSYSPTALRVSIPVY